MELVKSPSHWLSKKVKDFDFSTLDPVQTSGEMCRIMMASNGIGLAANQVALDARIFVMRPLEHKEVLKPFAIINPVIREVSDELVRSKEGCLSNTGLYLEIARPNRLVAQFLDLDAKECIIELTGIDARCFLHEYDHLEGIEYTDRVSKLKLDLAKKRQEKLFKRKKKQWLIPAKNSN
jgi:peptide deformylase